jgi:hypothetical protein
MPDTLSLVDTLNSYSPLGLAAVVALLAVRRLYAYARAKLSPTPTPPTAAGVPAVPPQAQPHPLLSAALGALYAGTGHTVPANLTQLHPDLLTQLVTEAGGLASAAGITLPFTPTPASPPPPGTTPGHP